MNIENKLFVANSMELLWKFPRISIDLCVTSPPYYNARKYDNLRLFKNARAWTMFCLEMLLAIKHVIKEDGVIWWNSGPGYENNRRLTTIYEIILEAKNWGLHLIDELPWCKTTYLPKVYRNRPYPAWEHNLIFSKDPDLVVYHKDNVRVPYAESTLKRLEYPVGDIQMTEDGKAPNRKMVKAHPDGKTVPNYFVMAGDKTRRDHPAPMKPELANWAIRAYSEPGDIVLDPMVGCGTTCVEAKRLGRNYVGIDLSEEYIEMTRKALEETENGTQK
ncbi:hypothetical protein LCGC14_0869600 [marine sediment metagenome]|uniref:site-specific DNA-methyltransferase (cytosine-N(4)-specific) n=1 Tax=marine sediment metagenome TaxID=412755 RepID=A0A0F9P9Y7_9ZZZZ